ncbi:terpene synthase family protein [Streptomyces sp. NPDC059003]|uniref:terpene synthase family protein n=1 Tax=Streptomyces sp. NPDC059003 TaxID=3346691 RepID=UPI003682E989
MTAVTDVFDAKEFYFPGPPTGLFRLGVHPRMEELDLRHSHWLRQWARPLCADEEEFVDYLGQRNGSYGFYSHPACPDDRILTIVNLYALLTILDDYYADPLKLGADPEGALVMAERLSLLHETGEFPPDCLFSQAFHQLDTELRAIMPPRQKERCNKLLRDFYHGCAREVPSRMQRAVLEKDPYLNVRKDTIGCHWILGFSEYALGIDLTDELQCSADLRKLNFLITEHMIVLNDLFSFRKELRHGDLINSVVSACRSQGITLQESVNRAHKHLGDLEKAIAATQMSLLDGEFVDNPSVQAYVHDVSSIPAATWYWQYATTRYHGGPGYVWDGNTKGTINIADRYTVYSPPRMPPPDKQSTIRNPCTPTPNGWREGFWLA